MGGEYVHVWNYQTLEGWERWFLLLIVLVTCSSCRSHGPFPIHFGMSVFQLLFRLSHWWDFTDAAWDISRRHDLTANSLSQSFLPVFPEPSVLEFRCRLSSQEREHQAFFWCCMVSPENINTNNITSALKCACVCSNNYEKRGHEF